jgi:CRP/FNR family cyclic AMP-dependent transcriptional regulator
MNSSAPSLQDVQASRLAAGLGSAQVAVLAGLLVQESYATGQSLAREGSSDNRLYAVIQGSLSVVKNHGGTEEAVLATLGEGEFAHELGFLDGAVRYASLVAATPLRVLVLEREKLESLIDTHPRILYAVMCAIVRTVHRVQTRLSVQATELTNYIVKQHGRY